METTIPQFLFIFLVAISIQIIFACLVYGVLMVLNFIFAEPVEEFSEVKKSDLENGQIKSQIL